ITEQEYLEACRSNLPALIFLMKPEHQWPEELRDTGTDGRRIDALRARLHLDRTVSFFTTPEDLAEQLAAALARHAQAERTARVGPLGLAAGQCPGCQYVHADWQQRSTCDRCRTPLREPCPDCGANNGVWCRFCDGCQVEIPTALAAAERELKA